MNGTGMPAWGSVLSAEQRWQVIAYIKRFASDLFDNPAFDPYQHVMPPGKPVKASAESLIADGRKAYEQAKCFECHGALGRGDGGKGADLRDDRGFPARPLDMDLKWKFKGGRTVQDFYMRLTTGLDGTPMPSYAKTLTDEQRWALAYYSISLPDYSASEQSTPTVLVAQRRTGTLPTTSDDPAWQTATEFFLPLSAQATFRPRWQNASVTDLAVRALYSDEEIALLLSWDDPTADTLPADSTRAMADGWPSPATAPVGTSETYPVLYADSGRTRVRYPDAAEVMLPVQVREAGPLPHFVYGGVTDPVELWRWKSELEHAATPAPGVVKLTSRGPERPPQPDSTGGPHVGGGGQWKDGRWSVVIRLPVPARSVGGEPPATTPFVPVAFHLWDGGNGETGLRMALSPWYYLKLATPVSPVKYLVVLLAFVGAAIAEFGLVRWTRDRAARGELAAYGIDRRAG
jgi:DMSO reductase family type II enzyme heme b subunit